MSKKNYGYCPNCGEPLERCPDCPDCSEVLCWLCEGVQHEKDHRDWKRDEEHVWNEREWDVW